MGTKKGLEEYTLDNLLDEIAMRCDGSIENIGTADLVTELSRRKEVHTTLIDEGETVRHVVRGPAVVLTYFD